MEFDKNYKRRFSLQEDFMNYSIDDILYGIMYYLATYHPIEKKLYLTKANLTKQKKVIYDLCDLNSRKLKSHIDKLIEKKLISEATIKCGKIECEAYVFDYDADGTYQLVDWNMLWYVVSTRNKAAVQIYVYLLNKFLWKQASGERYSFTDKELQIALGYSTGTKLVNSLISNVLESLSREGIIHYEEYYETVINEISGKEIPTPKKRLVFVAETKEELYKKQN